MEQAPSYQTEKSEVGIHLASSKFKIVEVPVPAATDRTLYQVCFL